MFSLGFWKGISCPKLNFWRRKKIFLSKCECVTRLAGLVCSSINHLCLARGQVTSPCPPPDQCSLILFFCLQVTIAHQKMLTFLLLFIDFWWLSKYVSNIPIWQVTYTYPSITLMVPFLLIFISKMVYQAYQEGWSVVTLTDKVMFVWSLVKDDSVLLFKNFNSNPPFDCG